MTTDIVGKYKYKFQRPAIYRIMAVGDLSDKFSDRLSGMQITVDRTKGDSPITSLVGQINDQSALMGVLNALHDYHLTILSVSVLDESI